MNDSMMVEYNITDIYVPETKIYIHCKCSSNLHAWFSRIVIGNNVISEIRRH